MEPHLVRISKFLSRVLRHRPQEAGLTLDAHGWADVDAVLAGAQRRGLSLDRETLGRVVAENDKQRFALSPDGQRIRANQGHSLPVDLELDPLAPPDVLYHGTAAQFLESIRRDGLRRGRRQHVHLSPDAATAARVGGRRGTAIVLTVQAARMHAERYAFYRSANGVWLTDRVPVAYLSFPESAPAVPPLAAGVDMPRTKTLWLKDEYLAQILAGRKTIEVRVAYGNIARLQPGDRLLLNDRHPYAVRRIGRYASFPELLAREDPAAIAPDLAPDGLLGALRAIYPAEKEALGVVALEIAAAQITARHRVFGDGWREAGGVQAGKYGRRLSTMNTRFVTSADDIRIAYEVTGSGPGIMLLHGGGGNRREWHDAGYVERLKDEFTVIAVDLRGHGESDKPVDPASYTTAKMGQDFLAVADACGVERFTLWGYSFGGNIGRYLAARSDRVARAVLVGCRFGSGAAGEWRQSMVDFHARWAPLVHAQAVSAPGGAFNPQMLSPEDQEDIRGLSFPGESVPVVLAWSGAMLDWSVLGPAELRCPALWVIGTENPNAMGSLEEYEDSLRASTVQVHVFEGFTHSQEFEEIDQVLPVVLAFART